MSEAPETVWVAVGSHRARGRLRSITGNPGQSFGRCETWPPRGEYYEVPARHAEALRRVKGLRVLRSRPAGELFRYWTAEELGSPARP